MAPVNITELPFEVLISIFEFFIYSVHDINEYLLSLSKEAAVNGSDQPRGQQIWTRNGNNNPRIQRISSRRLTLRLVCRHFRSIIDSPTFWAGKTVTLSRQHLNRPNSSRWSFVAKIGVRSINISLFIPLDTELGARLSGLKSLTNLRNLSYSCYFDKYSFQLLDNLSAIPLESIEIRNIDLVEGNLAVFLSVLSKFSRSLRLLTIQSGGRLGVASYGHYSRGNGESIREIEVCIVYDLENRMPVCSPNPWSWSISMVVKYGLLVLV